MLCAMRSGMPIPAPAVIAVLPAATLLLLLPVLDVLAPAAGDVGGNGKRLPPPCLLVGLILDGLVAEDDRLPVVPSEGEGGSA